MNASRTGVRYRRSPHLVCYWSDDHLIVHNYATNVRVRAMPVLCQILGLFGEWKSVDAVFGRDAAARRTAAAVLRRLERAGLLEASGRPASTRERAMASWGTWNPAAGFFHSFTRHLTYPTASTGHGVGQAHDVTVAKASAPQTRAPQALSIPLGPIKRTGEFADVLLQRRTWRRFGGGGITMIELSTLLNLTWGVQQWGETADGARVALKTSPSAGACQPLECYVLALHVKNLPRGIYHYAADRHRLTPVVRRAAPTKVTAYIPGQPFYKDAAALMIITAVFGRTQARYTSPRTYRSVLLEAGHVCQTFCLVATWLKLAPFCTARLADATIEKDLAIDGLTEAALYVAGVGARPRGVDWAPLPRPEFGDWASR
jgi:SagB-type dehydrogenase family enzyme